MKILSLNLWGGSAGSTALIEFLKQQDADVYCLQEMWHHGEEARQNLSSLMWHLEHVDSELFDHLSTALPGHRGIFKPQFDGIYGLAMFVRNGYEITAEGEQWIYRDKGWVSDEHPGDHARNVQYVTLARESGPLTIMNLHGLWRSGATKADLPDRIVQSKNLVKFASTFSNPVAILGDFNMLPDTESCRSIEAAGFRNLITEYGITSTRTRFYDKSERFADFAFVRGAEVTDFKVLPDEVSDHSPLLLEIA